MITRNGDSRELKIFDRFQVDRSLPKYNKEKANRGNNVIVSGSAMTFSDTSTNANGVWVGVPTNEPNEGWSGEISVDMPKKLNVFNRLKVAFTLKSRIKKQEAKREKQKLVTIRDYFTNLAQSFNELTPIAEIAEHYEKAILQAEELGQTSLVERLKDMLEVVRGEAHLIQMGLKHYVTEDQMCDFHEMVDEDKNLKLTWIKNFVKIIPKDVVDLKAKVDERGVFDNYVILHYDPKNDATDLTKEEREIKKDPILFGVIENSKKLYYVADWVDEYCDLTLEKMFEELGEQTLQINNQSLKTYINKVGDHKPRRKKVKSDFKK